MRRPTPLNPYRVIASGLMIPPFINTDDEGDVYPQNLDDPSRYPIIVCPYGTALQLMFPELIFAPRTTAAKILRPLFIKLELILNDDAKARYVPGNRSTHNIHTLIAVKNISLVDILNLKEYTSRVCLWYEVDECSYLKYLAATRLKVRTRISASELAFLSRVEAGKEVRYRGLTFYVDCQAESLDEMLNQVRRSIGWISSVLTKYKTTVVMFARNNMFANASNPLPFSRNGRYTVARIACREQPVNLLIIDWDDDIYSSLFQLDSRYSLLYNLLEIQVHTHDLDVLQS